MAAGSKPKGTLPQLMVSVHSPHLLKSLLGWPAAAAMAAMNWPQNAHLSHPAAEKPLVGGRTERAGWEVRIVRLLKQDSYSMKAMKVMRTNDV